MSAPSKFYVSDHSLLRYLQRVKKLDIEGLRGELKQKCAAAAMSGAKQLVDIGVKYRFAREGDVVTLVTVVAIGDVGDLHKVPLPRAYEKKDKRPHRHKMRLAREGRL